MNKLFKATVCILLLTIIWLLSVIGQQNPGALANRALDRDPTLAGKIDTIVRKGNTAYEQCSYVARQAAQLRLEHLVSQSQCEQMRTAQNDAIAQINSTARYATDEQLRTMSQLTDKFMVEIEPQFRTIEESYFTVKRIMREAAR
jgi:hypothetical protein